MSYCSFIENLPEGDKRRLHQEYHDKHYGFPLEDDNLLFGRLILEINQAGLSWETILKKEKTFIEAYDHFQIEKVANYNEEDRQRLLQNPGIIRNRLKINAAIENAKTILIIQKKYGTFKNWLDQHHPLSREEWVKLFKKTFKFTGGEIVNEFLMSLGYLPGAHQTNCPIYTEILKFKPKWTDIQQNK